MARGERLVAENPDVLQVADLPPWTRERLESLFIVHDLDAADDPADFVAGIADRICGIAITTPGVADRTLIEALPNLQIISAFAVGVDFIDLECAAERAVIVTNTPEVLTDCVADLGMGLLIAISRGIVEGDRYTRAGRWPREGDMRLTAALKGKTVGIVGFGRIGREVAKRAEAFGMKIAYHGRSRQDDVVHHYYGDAVSLAAASDYLVLCCPGGAETRHLVNRDVFAALGRDGFLVNIARGSVVDAAELVAALQADRIAGAAIDVFEDEPNVPEALFEFENVIVQPHQASATVETRTAMGDLMIHNLVQHFAGKPVSTPVV